MTKVLRWAAYLVGALLAVALLLAAWVWISSSRLVGQRLTAAPEKLAAPTPALLADAPRQLHILGCISCHGEGLRGEIFLNEPGVATIYAPNLTLVAAKASDQQLASALRQGVSHDGRPLLIMPSEGYQFLSGGEIAALIAAIRALPKGGKDTPPAKLGRMARVGLATGKFRVAPELVREFRASQIPYLGPQFASGRRLVQINCAECHGPQLHGQEVEPGVVSADLAIAGAYDLPAFTRLLREGVAPGKKLGLMADVSRSDFKYLNDDEIAAILAYLSERARRAP